MAAPQHLSASVDETVYDAVISGGRVIDPETGLDAVRNVGIDGDRIAVVTEAVLRGRRQIDARGQVVAPGFIDLHSHSQAILEGRLQVLDGVTTALELEAGVAPVGVAYERAAREGRPINYGFSVSWASIRRHVVAGAQLTGGALGFQHGLGSDDWRAPALPGETSAMLDLLGHELTDGAVGIGVLLGYAPATEPSEYVAVARLAESMGVPAFTHARPLVEQDPDVVIDGAEELTKVAGETGAHLHFCHINSTSTRYLDRVHRLVDGVRAEGATVTTEVYPYGAGMTGIGSDYFHPDRLHVLGATGTPEDVIYARTGETVASRERLLEIRDADPSGLAFIKAFDEAYDPERLVQIVGLPGAAVASDAVPLILDADQVLDAFQWPPPQSARMHPRGAGTFAKTLRVGVRETGTLPLAEALAKCSLYPAQILESAVPSMRQRGRIQEGCYADVVVFDPETVTDTATYQDPVRPSAGFAHVIVNGEEIVRDAQLQVDVLPGRPVRAGL
ncbi:amidohydrolase family protein [Aeromicrobium terrae]|uniref:Amidohydrolase family protein n=2 Tax=Aeromicrobium terrae TaxID=2498846 RepID=A0A5C8NID9_9ACTN|nr:amidohydrolase family protein [Aeromicrobium terrae]